MMNFRKLITFLFVFRFGIETGRADLGTLTNDYGRIDNIKNENIHVASSLTLTDCIRECAEFHRYYTEYFGEDCYAYNYDIRRYTCELIHSEEPLIYSVGFQTQWMTGFKSSTDDKMATFYP